MYPELTARYCHTFPSLGDPYPLESGPSRWAGFSASSGRKVPITVLEVDGYQLDGQNFWPTAISIEGPYKIASSLPRSWICTAFLQGLEPLPQALCGRSMVDANESRQGAGFHNDSQLKLKWNNLR